MRRIEKNPLRQSSARRVRGIEEKKEERKVISKE